MYVSISGDTHMYVGVSGGQEILLAYLLGLFNILTLLYVFHTVRSTSLIM